MTEQEQIVYTTGYKSSKYYHLDKDCKRMNRSDNIVERKLSEIDHYELCKTCDPEHDPKRTNHVGAICPNCGERQPRLVDHLPCND